MNKTIQLNIVKILFIFTIICVGFIPMNVNSSSTGKNFSEIISCNDDIEDSSDSTSLNLRAFDLL